MIKELLEYQNKERDKLALIDKLEGGKGKREMDEANAVISSSKKALLSLENDAKVLLGNFQSVTKNLNEIFEKIASYNKTMGNNETEDDATNNIAYVSGLLSKVSAYESQLNDISAKINAKTQMFEDAKSQVVKAQKVVATATAQYENDKTKLVPEIELLTKELTELSKKVDSKILEKFKNVRKSRKKGDIAVSVNGNRCGGCHFELPLSQMHNITTNGYIVCEECERIIYK